MVGANGNAVMRELRRLIGWTLMGRGDSEPCRSVTVIIECAGLVTASGPSMTKTLLMEKPTQLSPLGRRSSAVDIAAAGEGG